MQTTTGTTQQQTKTQLTEKMIPFVEPVYEIIQLATTGAPQHAPIDPSSIYFAIEFA